MEKQHKRYKVKALLIRYRNEKKVYIAANWSTLKSGYKGRLEGKVWKRNTETQSQALSIRYRKKKSESISERTEV